MTGPDRLAIFRARVQAASAHADLGHPGSWVFCSAPACRDAQNFVPAWPEVDLGDADEISREIVFHRALLAGEPGLAPVALSPRARLSAIALCGAGMLGALLLAWSLQ